MWRCLGLVVVLACGPPSRTDDGADAGTGGGGDVLADAGTGGAADAGGGTFDAGGASDGGGATDAGGATDGGGASDGGMAMPDAMPDAPPGVITGGPCISGSAGATAYRIRWANGGNTAYVVYEVHGLPDKSRNKAGAYGYQIGYTPTFVDPYLGDGGLQLDGSSFVDLDLSTVGVSQISRATLSIYGRSFHTTASGSFNWQTFEGIGSTPTNFVSNGAPYQWYSADMTTEISPGDGGVKIRIKAGPSSGSLVVNRIELCLEAS